MEINQAWIDQQRAVCEAATPGPWLAMKKGNKVPSFAVVRFPTAEGPVSIASSISPKGRDYEFIAAARTAMPAALDALEAAYAEIASLQAERDAAIRDLKWLSNEYKFCTTCKLDNGNGVWDCNDERCDAENHYEWRGLCTENTDAPAVGEDGKEEQ